MCQKAWKRTHSPQIKERMKMALYCVQHDGQPDYVEADSMNDAIRVWRSYIAKENNDEQFDPDSCALISDDAVIREARP